MTCAIYIRVKHNYFKRENQCAKTANSRVRIMIQKKFIIFLMLVIPMCLSIHI